MDLFIEVMFELAILFIVIGLVSLLVQFYPTLATTLMFVGAFAVAIFLSMRG